MGWNNPMVPWHELERALSGKLRAGPGPSRSVVTAARRPGVPGPANVAAVQATEVLKQNSRGVCRTPCHSAFSFLDGSTTPEALVAEGPRLGLNALALTDHDGFYGAVRFSEAAQENGLRTIYGAELSLGLPEPQIGAPDPVGDHLLALARGQEGYPRLTVGHRRAQLTARRRAARSTTSTAGGGRPGALVILTGCRKGTARRALAPHGPAAGGRGHRAADCSGADSVVSS